MDCKYVRQSSCLCFTFHPLASSLFYLTNSKNRLRIIEENLYTGLVKNQLAVPLRQQNLNVDNYILNYYPQEKQVILTLSNHILIYSLHLKALVFVGEASQNKSPCFIEKAVQKTGVLYFSATDHPSLLAIRLPECLKAGYIPNYIKFKLPEARAIALAAFHNKLVALCSDSSLRVWDSDSGSALKGIAIERVGQPLCLSFSKEGEHLLVGTRGGVVLGYDARTLGEKNIIILQKQIGKQAVQSLSWFHYSGEAQSRRFLVLTKDGNVKLFSFYLEKVRDSRQARQRYMGRANELSLLYINKCEITQQFQIGSHSYSNFIYFHPGVLLYMVDYYPRIYYPAIAPQYVHSFESLIPKKKNMYFQSNFLFIDGLLLKRLRNEPQTKLSLDSVLEYKGLKILKVDFRPKFVELEELPLDIKKGVPAHKIRYKIMITYYLESMVRCMVLSDICLSGTNDSIDNLKEYPGHAFLFLGPSSNIQPLLLTLEEDKQTITVLNENPPKDISLYRQEQRPYLKEQGKLYQKQLKIKIQKIFGTPFRNRYVVMYLSDNLLRFSNNIHVHSDLLDFDVCLTLGLRLDYTDIVMDVVWTSHGQIGCVLCLEKAILINDDLKVIRSVPIEGYAVQGQFVGYTLLVTTKVDVVCVDVSGEVLQLFCIQNYQSKYLILGVLADRILGIEKQDDKVTCKMRYFNLMQPLVSGYLNYYAHVGAPINPLALKTLIEALAPYHIVSEPFLALLNRHALTNFTRYFLESNLKLYSRTIRASTLDAEIRTQRFVDEGLWLQQRQNILNYLLYYEQLKDSADNYDVERSKQYYEKLVKLVGKESVISIQQVMKEEETKAAQRPSIVNSFGEQSLFQLYYEFSEKENIFVRMELLPFKANDDREWLGLNGLFLQSKIGDNNEEVDVNAVQEEQALQHEQEGEASDEEQEHQFASLIAYYRFDDGKGDLIDDLSDYHNEATVEGEPWTLLPENQPLELEDKWGKKCPPQYCITDAIVKREKKIASKFGKSFSFQLWMRTEQPSFTLLKLGDHFSFGMQDGTFFYSDKSIHSIPSTSEQPYVPGNWTNITFTFNSKEKKVMLYLNSIESYKGSGEVDFNRNGLQIGSQDFKGQFTEFRLWRKQLPLEIIKEYLRSPLELVAEKRRKMRMKIKERKKKRESKEGEGQFFPSIEL